ncbi:MAG: DNA polymerase III subunit epsilon [Proteobacteria bacterium]|nr:DNA polymerase III subunit epsilon [Pseudomonadota bacterium]
MRQIVLDTETTGLEVDKGHRIIEIGCVELVNRRITGQTFHRYLNPERDIDKGAIEVHGITRERLEKEPRFAQIQEEFLEFIRGAELIIHNAPFDVAFIDAELSRVPGEARRMAQWCTVLDSLVLARRMHPGQRNTLDALCKRYSVDNSHRDYHGALLDARILADVYLTMTGGQALLCLGMEDASRASGQGPAQARPRSQGRIPVISADPEEITAHERVLATLDKASSGKTVWRM